MQPETPAMVQPIISPKDAFLHELASRIGSPNFEHWFHNKTELTISDDEVTIGVGSPFLLTWMQRRFRGDAAAAAAVLGPSTQVRFEVNAALSVGLQSTGKQTTEPKEKRPPQAVVSKRQPAQGTRRLADLDDFVEGRCNELPLTAVRQICQSPGTKLNPLFLHGGVGTGKTHLLEGIHRQIRQRFPSLQVVLLNAESFANYFTQALRGHTLPSFRQRFRTVDCLLVDDIDFLDAKRGIQEEFLHTYKQLESRGRQVVLTSDCHPRLLTKLSDELTTRFLSGLVCRLETPDFETRRRIVERIAARMEADISPDVLEFVAQRFSNSVRELEGALNCLETYYSMTQKRIGLGSARQILASLERDCARIVRISDVEQAVCGFFGLEPEELKSSKRHRTVSQPRMLAMYLIRKHTSAAYSEIGQYFGGRNHSTVMSAEKKVRSWLKQGVAVSVASRSLTLDEVVETLEHQLQAS